MAAHGHTAQTHNGINKGNEWKTEPGETKKRKGRWYIDMSKIFDQKGGGPEQVMSLKREVAKVKSKSGQAYAPGKGDFVNMGYSKGKMF